jgi:hypothetical protein
MLAKKLLSALYSNLGALSDVSRTSLRDPVLITLQVEIGGRGSREGNVSGVQSVVKERRVAVYKHS